jgi:hypothetical protein
MLSIIAASGALAFVSSFLLLKAGLTSMAIRYPLVTVVGYGGFLGLVRLWVHRYQLRQSKRTKTEDLGLIEGVEIPLDALGHGAGVGEGAAMHEGLAAVGEGLPIVAAIAVIVAAVGATAYTVYIAPPLFAELVVDVAIASGAYRGLRDQTQVSWLRRAFRRTVVPALIVTAVLGAAGFVMQTVFPGATSIGRVWERIFP